MIPSFNVMQGRVSKKNPFKAVWGLVEQFRTYEEAEEYITSGSDKQFFYKIEKVWR